MPTILRFRGFNIIVFVDDHPPAHVHVRGKGIEVLYALNCPAGRVTHQADRTGRLSPADRRAIEQFLQDNVKALCAAWEVIDELR